MDPHYRSYGVSAWNTKGYKYLITLSTLTDIWWKADNACHCLFHSELSISGNIIIDTKCIKKSFFFPPNIFYTCKHKFGSFFFFALNDEMSN